MSTTPASSVTRAATTRRTLLVGVTSAGLALAGCTADQGSGRSAGAESQTTAPQPALDPDVTVAGLALRAERQVLDLVTRTRERHAALAGPLAPVAAAQERHVSILSEAVPDEPASPSPSAPGSPSADAGPRTAVPGDPAKALRALVKAQRGLAISHKRHAFVAQSGAFARLLASMAASAAQHGVVLASAAPDGSGR